MLGQKAPSAKRCIKTGTSRTGTARHKRCQKAPSAKRCIKTGGKLAFVEGETESESTERQKVH